MINLSLLVSNNYKSHIACVRVDGCEMYTVSVLSCLPCMCVYVCGLHWEKGLRKQLKVVSRRDLRGK